MFRRTDDPISSRCSHLILFGMLGFAVLLSTLICPRGSPLSAQFGLFVLCFVRYFNIFDGGPYDHVYLMYCRFVSPGTVNESGGPTNDFS